MSTSAASTFSETKIYLAYIFLLLFSLSGIWGILARGSHLNAQHAAIDETRTATHLGAPSKSAELIKPDSIGTELWRNLRGPLGILFTQIIVILIAARVFNRLFRLIGQPPVM